MTTSIFVSTCIQPTVLHKKKMFRSRFRSCMHLRKVVSVFVYFFSVPVLIEIHVSRHPNIKILLHLRVNESRCVLLLLETFFLYFIWGLWTRKHAIKHGYVSADPAFLCEGDHDVSRIVSSTFRFMYDYYYHLSLSSIKSVSFLLVN